MNTTTFAESLGVNVTVIYNIVKGRRSKPSFELLQKILDTNRDLSVAWFIKGEGSMWHDLVITAQSVSPSQLQVEDRIDELFTRLRISKQGSHEIQELEELVMFLLQEGVEQKRVLIVLYERQQNMVKSLQKKLKLKTKS